MSHVSQRGYFAFPVLKAAVVAASLFLNRLAFLVHVWPLVMGLLFFESMTSAAAAHLLQLTGSLFIGGSVSSL